MEGVKTTRKERLNKAILFLKQAGHIRTQQDLANKMGYNKSSMSAAVNGNPEYLTDRFMVSFDKSFPGLFSLQWLLFGKGDMLAEVEMATTPQMVPAIPMSVAGGVLRDATGDNATLPDCEMVMSPVNNAQFAIGVYGDSMEPTYPSGCRVFIRKIDPNAFISWGNVFVLDTVNGIYIKEVRHGSDPQHILCVSHNTACGYEPFEVALKDIYGMYRVLASVQIVQ